MGSVIRRYCTQCIKGKGAEPSSCGVEPSQGRPYNYDTHLQLFVKVRNEGKQSFDMFYGGDGCKSKELLDVLS